MWEFERAAREADARLRKMKKLRAAGELMKAALMCPHGHWYSLDGDAANTEGDPRYGEGGERCLHCNSVVTDTSENPGIIHACEPTWAKEEK